MSDVLGEICARKRADVAKRRARIPFAEVEAAARAAPLPRGFAAALGAVEGRYALIAELKRASPSKGLIRADFDPPALARAYAEGGAACLSVLTEQHWFDGRDAYLAAARAAVPLPVLRKDFTVDLYQVAEARALGADAVLLIVAALSDAELTSFADAAREFALDVLLEVHDEHELDRALKIDAPLIGINNRNLKTLDVDLVTFEKLAPRAPKDRLLVAESGIAVRTDMDRLAAAGARAFLVGETLMRQDDVAAATRQLIGG